MYNFIFLYLGLFALLAQLIIFRELSVLFYGNELFLGTFLASWMFWAGGGSLLIKRLLNEKRPSAKYFSHGFMTLSFVLPVTILTIRLSKSLFYFGEFIGPVGTILFTFAVMSFLCFILGSQFTLACAIASDKIKKEMALSRVYLCEAFGAVIGGVLFTYLLIGFVPTFTVAVVLSFLCLLVGWGLGAKEISINRLLLPALALALLCGNFFLEPAVNRIQWTKYELIRQKEARNATLTLVKMGSITNVFIDGMISASFPNPESYEPVAHWPLLATEKPVRLLILGDVSLGLLKEALKHNPESVDYVVLDHSFLDLVGPYLGVEDRAALKDPRITIHYLDARLFVKQQRDRYDAVIINIPDVPNLKLNRFYTQEFYGQIKSILKPTGILALSVTSSENYLSPQTKMFNASVYRTLKSVFGSVEMIPGDNMMFLCGLSAIDMRPEIILQRLSKRGISNRYVIPSYIEYKLETRRRAELKRTLEETSGVVINRDFRPTTYYYFTNFWLNKFASPLGCLLGGILLVLIGAVIAGKRKSLVSLAREKECLIIFIIGFVGMLLEVILLLGFQIISGYVYWQMGILFAAFMLGLFLGSAIGTRAQHHSRQMHSRYLSLSSIAMAGLSVAAEFLLPHLVNASTAQNIGIFTGLLMLIGIIVGASFVIAGFLMGAQEIVLKAGRLYAADLWGAASGAMLSTNFIIPLWGLPGALNFSAILGLVGWGAYLITLNILNDYEK